MGMSRAFFIWSLFFIGGIFLTSFFEAPAAVYLAAIVVAVWMVAAFWKKPPGVLVGGTILAALAGAWLVSDRIEKVNHRPLAQAQINFYGRITEIRKIESYQDVMIRSENENLGVLARLPFREGLAVGKAVQADCLLETPKNTDEFDYGIYLATKGISYLCKKPRIEQIENSKPGLYGNLVSYRRRLEQVLGRTIPQPEASLAGGIVFGGSGSFSEELKEAFSRSGMTHIVAVSGYNVAIISQCFMFLAIAVGFWRKQAAVLAMGAIILFVVAIGYPSSAIRAAVMGCMLLWATFCGRLSDGWNAVVIAAAVMLATNPLLARWDVGFQLSFGATLGIMSLSSIWQKIDLRSQALSNIAQLVFVSLSAQAFVMPIIAYDFHTVSLISILANVLILPIIPFAMLTAFAAAVCGALWLPLALPFSWVTFMLLRYVVAVVEIFSSMEWSSMDIGPLHPAYIAAYYVMLVLMIKKLRKIYLPNRCANGTTKPSI